VNVIERNGARLHWREDGDPAGTPILFSNSLGTDLRLWDAVLPAFADNYRIVRYDLRGHGLSEATGPCFGMRDLIEDAAFLIESIAKGPAVYVGLSIGGMIGQGLATRYPHLVSRLVLSNSAGRMGTADMWRDRIATIEVGGLEALVEAILDRWFGPAYRPRPDVSLWRRMLLSTSQTGYVNCCRAIAESDFQEAQARIACPTLCISGDEDGACPPEEVKAMAARIPHARYVDLPDVGHLPPVEAPSVFASHLTEFFREKAHG